MPCTTKSTSNSALLMTGDGRVFIAPRGVGCGKEYQYHNCMKMTGLSKSFGDAESVFCPDPHKSGRFIEVAVIQGEESRWTATLTGPKGACGKSVLRQLADRHGCEFDAQIHFGRCVDPTRFEEFDMAMVVEGMRVTDYSTDDLVALNPSEVAMINETISFSARTVYELYGTEMFEVGGNITADSMALAITYCPTDDCDDCDENCLDFYTLQVPFITNGNGQNIIIGHTHDGGVSWEEFTIPCAAIISNPLASYNISCAGDYLLVTLNELGGPGHAWLIPTDDIVNGVDTGTAFTNVGFTIYDQFYHQGTAILVGASGQIATINTATMIATPPSSPFPSTWLTIDGIDLDNYIVGGRVGQLARSKDGSALQRVTILDQGGIVTDDIVSVAMKSENDWYVATTAGNLYCTNNGGKTFRRASIFPGCITAMQFPSASVGYAAIADPAVIYRTIDGGTTWSPLDDTHDAFPDTAILTGFAACPSDPNYFIVTGRVPVMALINPCAAGGGTAVEGDSGVIVLGQPA